MDNISESHNSIFYRADYTKIIEYNLISKRKQIIYTTKRYYIDQYYINNKHKMVAHFGENCIYWNNQLISYIPPHFDSCNVLLINNEIYVLYSSGYNMICSNLKTTITTTNLYRLYSSFSGKRLIMYSHKHWYIKNTPNHIEDINKINQSDIIFDFTGVFFCYWITNSDVVIRTWGMNGQKAVFMVYNLETKNALNVPLLSEIFDAINYLIIQFQQSVQIYDIQTMKLLNTIQFVDKIIFYHKRHNIAITQDLNYYQITNKLTLQKVNIQINYYIDMHICPNQIMDIIINNNIIDIPDDILYCELYHALIKYIP